MSEIFEGLMDELAEAKKDYAKKHELDEFLEATLSIESEEIVDILMGLLPTSTTNTYTISKNIVDIIDYTKDRLKTAGINANRSNIINCLINLSRIKFLEGEVEEFDEVNVYGLDMFNRNYFKKYFSLTRGEVDKAEIEKFGLVLTPGKMSITLAISKENLIFLEELVENNGSVKISNVINMLLEGLLIKKIK